MPGVISGLLGFGRSSAGIFTGADGATWQQAAADVPRFQGPAGRLVVEGARTNSIPNPRGEGSNGTTWPTGWGFITAGGLSLAGCTQISTAGRPGVRLRFSGTPTGTSFSFTCDASGATAAAGQYWAGGAWMAQASGSPAIGCNPRLVPRDASNVVLGMGGNNLATGANLTTTPQAVRHIPSGTLPTNTATLRVFFECSGLTSGVAADFTLDVLSPQLEQGRTYSSPILPAAGAPAATARAADVPAYTLSAALAARGTLVATVMLPQAAPGGIDQGIWQLDDGSDNNRIVLRNTAGGSTVQALVVSGGTTVATLSPGSMVAGTAFRVAVGWSSSGASASLGGSAAVSTASIATGLTRLLVGHAATALNRAAFGEVGSLDLHPTRLPDATLQALTLN